MLYSEFTQACQGATYEQFEIFERIYMDNTHMSKEDAYALWQQTYGITRALRESSIQMIVESLVTFNNYGLHWLESRFIPALQASTSGLKFIDPIEVDGVFLQLEQFDQVGGNKKFTIMVLDDAVNDVWFVAPYYLTTPDYALFPCGGESS